mgnify:CR=1 FL=1
MKNRIEKSDSAELLQINKYPKLFLAKDDQAQQHWHAFESSTKTKMMPEMSIAPRSRISDVVRWDACSAISPSKAKSSPLIAIEMREKIATAIQALFPHFWAQPTGKWWDNLLDAFLKFSWICSKEFKKFSQGYRHQSQSEKSSAHGAVFFCHEVLGVPHQYQSAL